MSNMRARSLPRVREALEKAERARFYKQRTNKYTDEVRLMQALTGLENQRIAALARIKEQTMDLRMQALHIRDEEKAYLESDSIGLEELKRKVEINKQRNFLQEAKYKPKRIRDNFVRRYEQWKAEDDDDEDWRVEMPQREPRVKLNEQLIYPAKRERKQNRRQYLEITRRPDSKLGAKAVLRLRDLFTDDRTDADRLFFEELELELSARSDSESQQQQQQPQPMSERLQPAEASPFVTQQLGAMQSVQAQAMQRILSQIESTRRSIRFWEIPSSQCTREKLDECHQRRRFRVRRRKPKPGDEQEQQHDEEQDEDDGAEDNFDGKIRFRRANRRQMKKKPMGTADAHDQPSSGSDGESASASATEDGGDDEQRERVRKLSKRLSRGFHADDFTKRRQSLLQELDEEGVGPEERQRRMREFEKAWTEVLKCKYIRGYEPPEMRLPEGQTATDFVFGEAQARVLEKIVEEAVAERTTASGNKSGEALKNSDAGSDEEIHKKPEAEADDGKKLASGTEESDEKPEVRTGEDAVEKSEAATNEEMSTSEKYKSSRSNHIEDEADRTVLDEDNNS